MGGGPFHQPSGWFTQEIDHSETDRWNVAVLPNRSRTSGRGRIPMFTHCQNPEPVADIKPAQNNIVPRTTKPQWSINHRYATTLLTRTFCCFVISGLCIYPRRGLKPSGIARSLRAHCGTGTMLFWSFESSSDRYSSPAEIYWRIKRFGCFLYVKCGDFVPGKCRI